MHRNRPPPDRGAPWRSAMCLIERGPVAGRLPPGLAQGPEGLLSSWLWDQLAKAAAAEPDGLLPSRTRGLRSAGVVR